MAEAIVGGIGVVVALIALRTSVAALHDAYRPVVRVARMYVPIAGGGPVDTSIVLKNIGRGPALAVMLFEGLAANATPMFALELVEPLGGPGVAGEPSRPGRVEASFKDSGRVLSLGQTYRLLYQDLAGRWHETRFEHRAEGFAVTLRGPLRWRQRFAGSRLPTAAKDNAFVVNR